MPDPVTRKGYCFDLIVLAGKPTSLRIWEIWPKKALPSGGTKTSGSIGLVSWDPGFRAYRFRSTQDTIMDAMMLLDLGKFCTLQTELELRRRVEAAG
jgi:hypothetical protein